MPRTHIDGPVEQSFAQARLWLIARLYPQSTWYLTPLATRLQGPLQVDALHTALQALEEHHKLLHTTFEQHNSIKLQIVHPFVPKQTDIIQIPGRDWKVLMQSLNQEQVTPFNLETEYGWRISIFRLDKEDHVLSIVMHHMVTDGWSIDILQRELARFYSAAIQGREPLSQVHSLPIQYRDFAAWQRQEAQAAENQLEYWKQQLDGSQPAQLLCDKPRPTVPSGTAKVHEISIDSDLYHNLDLFSKEYQTTPFAVLLTAFRTVHYCLTGVEDATIGIPITNQNHQELEDLIGFFVNLQCIRITVKEEENESFVSLVRQVLSTTTTASAHQDVPFERVVAAVQQGSRDQSRNPLVQIIFTLHASKKRMNFHLDGLETEPVGDTETSRFDLEFHLFHEDHCLRLCVVFSDDLFNFSSITNLTSTFLEILRRGLTEPAVPLATMPLTDGLSTITNMGLTQVVQTDYPRNSSVPELFCQQAAICRDVLAVKDASTQLTYAKLDEKSDQVANWLAQ